MERLYDTTMTKQKISSHDPLATGVKIIKTYVQTLPHESGVYRMLNAKQKVLYVGKALSLKKRVSNYTLPHKLPLRLQRMIAETTSMEFVVTPSEVEALLLEANLIKHYDPPYNIRLKDDKFFAYIHLSDHRWTRLSKYRGDRKEGGDFFGPFVSSGAIDEVIIMLQKTFKTRSCSDSYFKARTRPCLQYHIKRCSAPCVKKISNGGYQEAVSQVKNVLCGKTQRVQKELTTKMIQESTKLHYERAGQIRDQIKALTRLQSHQNVNITDLKNADFFALAIQEQHQGQHVCIQGFFYRKGSNYGTHSFFIQGITGQPIEQSPEQSMEKIFTAFLTQFYVKKEIPSHIFTNITLSDPLLHQALQKQASHKVTLSTPQRGAKKNVLKSVLQNATDALKRQSLSTQKEQEHLDSLSTILSLSRPLERIEVYDNSHIQGTHAIGSMIVSGTQGFEKKHYRKFTIKTNEVTAGDDFAMMAHVLKRRFQGSLTKNKERSPFPDLVLIDGGKGQLSAAQKIFDELNIDIPLLAIAKGVHRNAGNESFFSKECPQGFKLHDHRATLHYLQRLRDEAHRFAITFHRAKRSKAMKRSLLDDINGIGPARKKALLQHFGSAVAVKSASIKDIENVEGMSKNLAKKVYFSLHSS